MNTRHVLLALTLSASVAATSVQAQDLTKQFPVQGAGSGGATKKTPRKKRPSQAQLAQKSSFPSIASSQIKGAVSATDLAGAKKAEGKNATVVGTVTKVFAPGSGSIVLLNFAADYKKAVVGAIKASDFSKFPDLAALKGKKVALMGKMVIYKGSPEIELTTAGAIKLVK
jgi:hypothetical protein